LRIHSAELKTSAYSARDFPADGLPEVAFLGRSNVGKSTLLNGLLGRKNLARTSATPGKTRALYFYLINEKFYFVDLPGYGYARVSREVRRDWIPLIEKYLENRDSLRGCIHLVDCRHLPSEDDLLMSGWLRFHRLPAVTVATKADKLSRGALVRSLALIRARLELPEADPLIACSSRTGAGREALWGALAGLLAPALKSG
jgi:GTP-binding protein